MMTVKSRFICQECGAESLKWQGQCPQCRQWNCLAEEAASPPQPPVHFKKDPMSQKPIRLGDKVFKESSARISTGMKELNRVLGGGLVKGSYILLGGAPGIGKSTLLLQMAEGLARAGAGGAKGQTVFYVSAEESVGQTELRARRLGLEKTSSVFILNETSLDRIFHHAEKIKPDVLVVDSIQTVQLSGVMSAPGTVSQVRECAGQLMNFAKNTQTTVFIIGHITKEGQLAGPRLLEHTVDTVLSFDGDPHYNFRLLRALKNRFGASNEVGVFQMSSEGLKGVSNPSQFFLEERGQELIGSVVFPAVQGLRPLLCEVQALVVRSYLSMPRRTAIGIDMNRLNMVTAVLDRYLKLGLAQYDVFVNVAGGLKITEPAGDMAAAQALISAKTKKPVNNVSCFFGELGLTGELRAGAFFEERIKEAVKLGFKQIYMPHKNKLNMKDKPLPKGVCLHGVNHIRSLSS